jgi:hypothetical protein
VATIVAVWLWTVIVGLTLGVLLSRDALHRVQRATTTVAPEDVVVGSHLGSLRRARDELDIAHLLSEHPAIRVLDVVPYVGRQLRSVRSLYGASHEVLAVGVHAIDRSQAGIAGMKKGGEARVNGMRTIATVAAQSQAHLEGIHLGSTQGLAGPLAHAQEKFAARIPKLTKALGELHATAQGLTSFLDGPRLYLVFAANNSEMRLGSGSFLSASFLSTNHGRIALFPMVPTATLALKPLLAAHVPLETDQAQIWGWLKPNQEWRNLGFSPRFDTTAKLSAQMIKARTGQQVDGVIAIDPIALNGLVSATGPVDVNGHQLSGKALLKYVFVDQYRGVSVFDTKQVARRDALGTIATEAIGRIDAGKWDTRSLVHALRTVGGGRHILAWSAHPKEQAAWHIAGVDGSVPNDGLFVGLHNRGGNKLDSFLDVNASMSTQRTSDLTNVSVTIKLQNKSPKGLPSYVQGPYPGSVGGAAGKYQGMLVFYVPSDATDMFVWSPNRDRVVAAGRDGTHQVMAMQIDLDRAKSDQLTLTFRVPKGDRRLVIVPSARYPAVQWSTGSKRFDDTGVRTIEL